MKSLKNNKILFLYSNTPNPIIEERLFLFKKKFKFEVDIIYINRVNSNLSFQEYLKNLNDINIHKIYALDSRGINFNKIKLIFRLISKIKKINKNFDYIYSVYPDMFLSSFIYKYVFNYKVKLIHEFQDIVSMPFIFEFTYYKMLNTSYKNFFTSPGFIDYIKENFNKEINRNSIYLPSLPFSKKLKKKSPNQSKNKKYITYGFFGILRYSFQVEIINFFLKLNSSNRIIVAGNGDYQQKVINKFKNNHRVKIFKTFSAEDLKSNILPKVDIVPCIYPDTVNYHYHIARRFFDALSNGIPVLVLNRSKYMLEYIDKYHVGYNFKDLQDLKKNQEKICSKFDFYKKNATKHKQIFDFENFLNKNYNIIFDFK